MKKIAFLITIASLTLLSCKKETPEPVTQTEVATIAPVDASTAENAVIYEANIRQYSPEGTFKAFTKDIPTLKKLGVKILWLMPIHEIGLKNRKAKGDLSVEQIPDETERKKYLGSPYSVKNYRSITPNYGSDDDFKKLVQTAHNNGMYIILDWVANHTAWDHPWVTEHPDYYTTDKNGKMISPFDWTDVVELDYTNPNLRKAMLEDMKYWLTKFDIDGFRCDVAAEVPTDFWENTQAELNKIKPVFMLMEAEQPQLMQKAFDMQYGWEVHHIFNGIAKGTKTVADFDNYMNNISKKYQPDDIYMNFTSNHDENSWNGSEYERMGNAAEALAALTYTMPGMPLIYNGQEYDLTKRLKFFEKDTIPHTIGKMMPVYEKLGTLKTSRIALNGGKNPASYTRLKTSNDKSILAFVREKKGKKIYFIANLSKTKQTVTLPLQGTYTNYMTQASETYNTNQSLQLLPWSYKILE